MLPQRKTSSLLLPFTSSSLTSVGNNHLCNYPNRSVGKKISLPENNIILLTNTPLSKEVQSQTSFCTHTRGSEADENLDLNAWLAGSYAGFAGSFVSGAYLEACCVSLVCLSCVPLYVPCITMKSCGIYAHFWLHRFWSSGVCSPVEFLLYLAVAKKKNLEIKMKITNFKSQAH